MLPAPLHGCERLHRLRLPDAPIVACCASKMRTVCAEGFTWGEKNWNAMVWGKVSIANWIIQVQQIPLTCPPSALESLTHSQAARPITVSACRISWSRKRGLRRSWRPVPAQIATGPPGGLGRVLLTDTCSIMNSTCKSFTGRLPPGAAGHRHHSVSIESS